MGKLQSLPEWQLEQLATGNNQGYENKIKLRRNIDLLVSLIKIKTGWTENEIRDYVKSNGGSGEEI